MKRRDQHDSAFKLVMESVLRPFPVDTHSGTELALAPLRADVVVERRALLPDELGLLGRVLNALPVLTVLEFKGPADPLTPAGFWQTLAYAALLARKEGVAPHTGVGAVVIAVACSEDMRGHIRDTGVESRPGWWVVPAAQTAALGIRLHYVLVKGLERRPDNLPFLLFSDRDEDLEYVLDLVLQDRRKRKIYARNLYSIRREKVRVLLQRKGIPLTEIVTVKQMIEDFGLRSIIDEVGLKRVVDEVGLKRVVDEVGAEELVRTIGFEEVVEQLVRELESKDPETRAALLEKLRSLLSMVDDQPPEDSPARTEQNR